MSWFGGFDLKVRCDAAPTADYIPTVGIDAVGTAASPPHRL